MNILIVGEFSGFAKHLKNGLKQLGHQVIVVMAPDSFKKFHGDKDDIVYGYNISLFGKPIKGSARILAPFRALWIRWKLNQLYKGCFPDLIVVINHSFITTTFYTPGTPQSFLEKQLKRGSKLILTECGSTPADCYNHQDFWQNRGRRIVLEDNRYSFLLNCSHVIIPTTYGYYENLMKYANYYQFDTSKVHHAIPLPIKVDQECTISSCVGRKMVIFHGIIRPQGVKTHFPFIAPIMAFIPQPLP